MGTGVCVSTKTAIIAGVIFLALVGYGIFAKNKMSDHDKAMKNYVEVVVPNALAYGDRMKTAAKAAKALSDSLAKTDTVKTKKIQNLTGTVRVLRKRNTDLANAALNDPNTSVEARAAIVGLQEEVDSLGKIIVVYEDLDTDQKLRIASLTTAYESEKFRADTLEQIVINIPRPPGPPTIFGLTLPRIPSWVGYAAVAVGGYAIGKQVVK